MNAINDSLKKKIYCHPVIITTLGITGTLGNIANLESIATSQSSIATAAPLWPDDARLVLLFVIFISGVIN